MITYSINKPMVIQRFNQFFCFFIPSYIFKIQIKFVFSVLYHHFCETYAEFCLFCQLYRTQCPSLLFLALPYWLAADLLCCLGNCFACSLSFSHSLFAVSIYLHLSLFFYFCLSLLLSPSLFLSVAFPLSFLLLLAPQRNQIQTKSLRRR